jgi:hypothetical protein
MLGRWNPAQPELFLPDHQSWGPAMSGKAELLISLTCMLGVFAFIAAIIAEAIR